MEKYIDSTTTIPNTCMLLIIASTYSLNLFLDDINHTRLSNSAEITELIAFTGDDLAHDVTHDLQWYQSVNKCWGRQRPELAFPEWVLGRSLTMKIFLEDVNRPITFLIWSMSSLEYVQYNTCGNRSAKKVVVRICRGVEEHVKIEEMEMRKWWGKR
jgi:hypothetical protein